MAGREPAMPTGPIAGKYQLEGLLGTGGMAKVYRARNIMLDRQVAVKVLLEDCAQDPSIVRRFLREARAATAVRHPNVVDVLDVIQDDTGRLYIVQELLEGHDLSQHVARSGGRLKPQEALEWIVPICDAVAVAHSLNIVHRDLKPENVFLARVGRDIVPKVLDFGVSKIHDPKELKLTTTNAVIGTPSYMSPEQIQDTQHVGPPSDVWGLGVVLYEILTGHLPYRATGANALMVAVCRDDPVPITERDPTIPTRLAGIIHRCLQRDQTARYPTAHELSNALREYAGMEVQSDADWQMGVDKALALPLDGLPAPARSLPVDDRPRVEARQKVATGSTTDRESDTRPAPPPAAPPLMDARVGSSKTTAPDSPPPGRPSAPRPLQATPVHGADRFSDDLAPSVDDEPLLELADVPELRRSFGRATPSADLSELRKDHRRHAARFSGSDAANAVASTVLVVAAAYALVLLRTSPRLWVGEVFAEMPHVPLIGLVLVFAVTGSYLSTRAFLRPLLPGLALTGAGLLASALFLLSVALETLWPAAPYRGTVAALVPEYASWAATVVPLGLSTVAFQRAMRSLRLGGSGFVFWGLAVLALCAAGVMQVAPDIAAAAFSE